MVVFLGIRPGQVPEEPQPEGLDPFRDWQAACSVPNRLTCSLPGVRDPKDFPQTPGVEGIKVLSHSLGDGPCFALLTFIYATSSHCCLSQLFVNG